MSGVPAGSGRDANLAAEDRDKATYDEVVEALRKACDVAIWMSGSPSFAAEGEAYEGWVERARPSLYEALAVLERTWADVPG